jgi:integrase
VDKLNFTPNEEQKKEIGKILLDSKINHLKNIYQKIEKEEYKKAKIQTIANTTNINLQQSRNEEKAKQEIKNEPIKTIQNTKEKYFKYQDSIDKWSKSTLQMNIRALKWLERYFEDKDISTINYDDLIEFRTSLLCVPDNVQNHFDANATFAEIIEGTEEQDLKTLSNNTINKTILRVNQYLTYMCKIKYMDGSDLTIPKYPDDSKEREAYTYEEIQKIKEVVEDIEEDKFITNIAIYQGMRLKEITQLTKNDIIQNNGMYCIDINTNNEKTTKTKKSVRLIPIHDKLLEIGFLDFVQSKQDGENLFSIDNLKFTKYYGKKYKDLINEEKTFYSLRHSFVNELIQKNQKLEHIQAFVGHSQSAKITFGYSDPINTKLLKELLEFIDY